MPSGPLGPGGSITDSVEANAEDCTHALVLRNGHRPTWFVASHRFLQWEHRRHCHGQAPRLIPLRHLSPRFAQCCIPPA
jgi:hypothetical protein